MSNEKYLSCILFKNEKGLLGKVATNLGNNDVNIEKISISTVNKIDFIQKVAVYTSGMKSEQVLNNIIKSMPGVLDVFTIKNVENISEVEICLINIQNINPSIIKIAKIISEVNNKLIYIDNKNSIYRILTLKFKADELINRIDEIDDKIEISRNMLFTNEAI